MRCYLPSRKHGLCHIIQMSIGNRIYCCYIMHNKNWNESKIAQLFINSPAIMAPSWSSCESFKKTPNFSSQLDSNINLDLRYNREESLIIIPWSAYTDINVILILVQKTSICECLSENPPSSHLLVLREIPF